MVLNGLRGVRRFRSREADLEAGHAAVIQIVSTSEAVLERRLAELQAKRGGGGSGIVTQNVLAVVGLGALAAMAPATVLGYMFRSQALNIPP